MKHLRPGKPGFRTALCVAAATAGTLAMAPAAPAVTPGTATLSFDCGFYGSGKATLTATQNGTAATISLSTSAITSPIPLGANSVASTLTLTKNGSGTAVFSGNANPAIPAGSPVSTGPLKGTVASGDKLSATSLKVVVLGITATCKATSAQSPGPFVF
ncbi:hypothetical protein [Streptomyces sp. NPDC048612]|uniref:hypothetical protein n=1 Tax=Streptomyces sp. NPDC048612 TaxID=3365579 RepID=UPI0037184DC4